MEKLEWEKVTSPSIALFASAIKLGREGCAIPCLVPFPNSIMGGSHPYFSRWRLDNVSILLDAVSESTSILFFESVSLFSNPHPPNESPLGICLIASIDESPSEEDHLNMPRAS